MLMFMVYLLLLVVIVILLAHLKLLPVFCYRLTCVRVSSLAYYYFNEQNQMLYTSSKPPVFANWLPLLVLHKESCPYEKIALLRSAEAVTTGYSNKCIRDFLTRIADRVPTGDNSFCFGTHKIDFTSTDVIDDAYRDAFEKNWLYSIALNKNSTVRIRFSYGTSSDIVLPISLDDSSKLLSKQKLPYINYVDGCPFVFLADEYECGNHDNVVALRELMTHVFSKLETMKATSPAIQPKVNPVAQQDKTRICEEKNNNTPKGELQ